MKKKFLNKKKIILFIEKIAQSGGPNKILKEYGQTRLPSGETLDILNIFKTNIQFYKFVLHKCINIYTINMLKFEQI